MGLARVGKVEPAIEAIESTDYEAIIDDISRAGGFVQ